MKAQQNDALVSNWRTQLAEHFEPRPETLIPALQFVQRQAGYLPREAITAVAQFLRVPESKAFGVASFYAQFYFQPRGRNTITVCRGTACHVRGSVALLKELENRLHVKAGGTTDDLSFSLETVACYGSCALAPVVVLNDVVHRQQSTSSVGKLLAAAGDGAPKGKASEAENGESGPRDDIRHEGERQ